MQKASIVAFVGLVLASPLAAEPLVEGRVRLSSGEVVAAAQVMLFDLAALQRGPVAQVTTDADGHFALPLAALGGPVVPQGFALGQNYPNPFNPSTIIPYQLPTAAHVRLEVFNVLGQRVATLVDEERPAGLHAARWDATDAAGQAVAAGVYIYRLRGVGVELTRRLVLVDGQAGTATVSAAVGAAVSAPSEPAERTYGIVVSGAGVVPYVDAAFAVQAEMGPVEFVLQSVEELPRGKALTCGMLGDVNNDGRVDLGDALLVVVFNLDPSIVAPNNGNIGLGDVTDDGQVNLDDLLAIMTYLANSSDASLPTGIGQTATRVNWVAGPIRRLTEDSGVGYYGNLVWSPNGRNIFFKSSGFDHDSIGQGKYGDPGIYFLNPFDYSWWEKWGSSWISRTDFGEQDGVPVWSPDGRYVAFDSERDGNRDIYLIDTETETEHRLTNNEAYDADPDWSPDGTQIAFVSRRAGNNEIYVMDAAGEDEYLRRLTNNSERDEDPAWSPDGTQIAYEYWGHLHVMDADGSNVRELTYCGENPAWSPDGIQIAYNESSFCIGNTRGTNIYVIDADSSNPQRLTHSRGYESNPVWAPDGRKIVFVSDRDGDWDNQEIYVMELLGSCR